MGTLLSLHPSVQKKLTDLHKGLMRLHKALLDTERKAYEEKHGPVESAHQVLSLVMHDPWFDWLHRISEGIVHIDEILENDDALFDDADDCLESFRTLFQGDSESDFMNRYRAALQRNPGAILAHIDVQKILAAK